MLRENYFCHEEIVFVQNYFHNYNDSNRCISAANYVDWGNCNYENNNINITDINVGMNIMRRPH